MKDFGAGVCD